MAEQKSALRQTLEAVADRMGYAEGTMSRGTKTDWEPVKKKKKKSKYGYTQEHKAAMEKAGVL